jgi:type VI secretion system protein ImpC
MAVNINRSASSCTAGARASAASKSGGAVEGLPTHTFPTDDGGVDMKCPTEIAISDRREAELAKNGFMPLVHRKNSDFAAFIGAQSLQKPAEYDDPDATANANLAPACSTCLPVNRFAHYLKCIVRDKVGSFKERTDMEKWLNNWIRTTSTATPPTRPKPPRRRSPWPLPKWWLKRSRQPGLLHVSKFFLRPHYQLEGLTVSLRLVSKLPSQKQP